MKILMVSSYLPYPLYSGGHIRLYNLLKYISTKHQITLVCEKRNYQSRHDIDEVKKVCERVITVDRKKQWTMKNIFSAGFSEESFLIVGHTNVSMEQIITKELNTSSYNLIHVETSYIMQNIPSTTLPIVLAEHNIEYLVYKRFTDTALFALRPLLYLDVYKLKKKEEGFW